MTITKARRATGRSRSGSNGGIRRSSGLSIVEFAAACAFGLPLVVIMIYGVLEANYYFAIKTNLDLANRRASQLMIDQYLKNKTYTASGSNTDLPTGMTFDVKTADGHYFIKGVGGNQFSWWWDFTSRPYTLTIKVSYPKSTTTDSSFTPFPNPDPLGLGTNFQIMTQSTFGVPG